MRCRAMNNPPTPLNGCAHEELSPDLSMAKRQSPRSAFAKRGPKPDVLGDLGK